MYKRLREREKKDRQTDLKSDKRISHLEERKRERERERDGRQTDIISIMQEVAVEKQMST